MKVVEFCSGYGGATAGIIAAGLEIEKSFDNWQIAVDAHQRWHPTAPCELRDVKTIEPDELKGRIVWASLPCFVAGTLVLTIDGYRPIEALSVGDLVLTHAGSWKPITSLMSRDGAKLRRIKAGGTPGVVTTDEHPFLVREQDRVWDNSKRSYTRTFSAPQWRNAETLTKTHMAGQILPSVILDARSEAFYWVVGRYLADGWRNTDKASGSGWVVICANAKEAQKLETRILEAGFTPTKHVERTVTKFHIFDKAFHDWLAPFGRYAHGKTVPGFALQLEQNLAAALLNGYISGDGYTCPRWGDQRVTTVSRALALGIALLAQRAFGVVASVRFCKTADSKNIEGRIVNQRDFYVVSIPKRNKEAFIEGSYGWKRVRENSDAGHGTVFNISVQDDESYIVENLIVHNCQPWSTANRVRRGKSHSSYYSLAHFAHQVQYAEMAILENVPGLAIESDGKTELEELRSACKKLGLTCDINLIPAWWFGVAQLRKRVIITINAPWTLFSPLMDVSDSFSSSPTASDGKGSRFLSDGSWDSGEKRKVRHDAVLASQGKARGAAGGAWEKKWSRAPTASEHAGHTSTNPATGEINFTGRSVLECAELQGVPLEHIEHLPKSHQYTLIGNAIPPVFCQGVMQTILGGI